MFPFFYWLDQYVDVIQRLIMGKAVLAPLLLLFIEEAGVPIIVPGDAIIAYTGYRLSMDRGGVGLWEAFIVAQIAVIAGATILFFLSRRWGQILVDKIGSFIFLKEKHIKHAERLFAKFGILGIIIGRHIPGLRMPVTFFAATSGVRYRTFVFSTFISTSIWIVFYLTIGKDLGVTFHQQLQHYVGLTVLGTLFLTLGIIALHFVGRYRKNRKSLNEKES